jgi:type II secretory pathway pseudopilin PulG
MASSVDWYSVLKDFAGPVATVIAAVAATGVTGVFAWQQSNTGKQQANTAAQQAAQQAKTAIDQLRFNLFEKRYAIYQDIENFLRTLINDADKPEFRAFDVAPRYRVIDEAKFFFSPATCEWLEAVRADCQEFLEWNAKPKLITPPPSLPLSFSDVRGTELAKLKSALVNHFSAMPDRFRDDMNFRQLTDR